MTTKFDRRLLLLAAAGLIAIDRDRRLVAAAGPQHGTSRSIYAGLYVLFAFLVARWNRGILPVAAALSMILAIFCAVGASSWFDATRSGFETALLPAP